MRGGAGAGRGTWGREGEAARRAGAAAAQAGACQGLAVGDRRGGGPGGDAGAGLADAEGLRDLGRGGVGGVAGLVGGDGAVVAARREAGHQAAAAVDRAGGRGLRAVSDRQAGAGRRCDRAGAIVGHGRRRAEAEGLRLFCLDLGDEDVSAGAVSPHRAAPGGAAVAGHIEIAAAVHGEGVAPIVSRAAEEGVPSQRAAAVERGGVGVVTTAKSPCRAAPGEGAGAGHSDVAAAVHGDGSAFIECRAAEEGVPGRMT